MQPLKSTLFKQQVYIQHMTIQRCEGVEHTTRVFNTLCSLLYSALLAEVDAHQVQQVQIRLVETDWTNNVPKVI